jgi:MFS family permease
MGVGTICMGYVPVAAVISNWFIQRRGKALGIALIGNVAPPLLAFPIQELISASGWRTAYLVLGAILLIVIVPLNLLLMRSGPRDLGLEPDGGGARKEAPGKPGRRVFVEVVDRKWAETEWRLGNSLKTFRFWALTGVMVTLGTANGTIMSHLVAMVVDMGRSREMAAFIFSLAGLVAAAGRMSGFLSDRIGREVTYTLLTALHIASVIALLVFLKDPQAWPLYFYAAAFGFGYGLCSPTLTAGAADLFIGRNFGRILGFANVAYGIGTGIGAWAGGAVFDLTGSYWGAMWITIPIYALMGLSYWAMAPRKVRRIRNSLSSVK